MNKYNFMRAYGDYELKEALKYIEEKNYKLITVTNYHNCLYIIFEKEIVVY